MTEQLLPVEVVRTCTCALCQAWLRAAANAIANRERRRSTLRVVEGGKGQEGKAA